MRAPEFWRHSGLASTLLLPFSWLYDVGRRIHLANAAPATLPIPVICVGNLTVGGAGKTPVALALGERLKTMGIHAFFLSRGYGGTFSGPLLVDPKHHGAHDVGDEPLLLAAMLPTIVAKDRKAGADLALSKGAQVIVMDDGLQNHALTQHLRLVVVDGVLGFGNGRLLPAGPLRTPIGEGLEGADALILVNPVDDLALPIDIPVLTAVTSPVSGQLLREQRLLAFCGIAYPHKFFATLHNLGGHVLAERSFPDHHCYRPRELDMLVADAKQLGAKLITTAKDWVRLPEQWRANVAVLNIALEFSDPIAFDHLLTAVMER